MNKEHKFTISDEDMIRIGEELGLVVSFGNEKSGVLNRDTGEIKSLDEAFWDSFLNVKDEKDMDLSIYAPDLLD